MPNSKKYNNPGQIKAFWSIAWYAFRAQTRNPATFAFGFIFPIVFISIFGLIGGGASKISVGVPSGDNENNAIVQSVKKLDFVTVKEDSEENLKVLVKQGKIAGILHVETLQETPPRYNATLQTSSANIVQSSELQGVIRGVVDQANLRLSGVTNPPIVLTQQEISGRQARYIDFAVPGQIGFALFSTAIMGTVFGLIYLKKALILKRMFATPTKALTILLAQGTSRLIMALMQTVLIIGFAVVVFHFYLPYGWVTFFELLLISAFGLIAFLGFGYFIAGRVNDENAASPLTNIVTLPQFLLSGVFFSVDSLPNWLQPIANNLPLSYFNMAIRKLTTEGAPLSATFPYLLGLAIWGAVMYILAARTFKWE